MKVFIMVLFLCLIAGCAKGRLDIIDTHGKVVGECSADFYWHWYGAQASVSYILNLCAQQHIARGYSISDESVLENDYSLPLATKVGAWNKKTAKKQFNAGSISEEEYGYILAAIEYKYRQKIELAAKELDQKLISKKDYKQVVAKAKLEFNGI